MTIESLAFLFFFPTLLSCALQQVQRVAKVPAPAALVLCGFLAQVVASTSNWSDDAEEYTGWEAVLVVLVPAVMVPTACALEWYTVKQQTVQLLFLSIVGVGVSVAVIAALVVYLLGYQECSLREAIVIGLVLSVNEHIHSSSQLQKVHASPELPVLIQAETLLSAGLIIVAFDVARESTDGLRVLAREGPVGLVMGVAGSVLVCWWQKWSRDKDGNAVIVLSLLLYYLSIAPGIYAGGALATLSYSSYLCASGQLHLTPQAQSALLTTWAAVKTNIQAIVYVCGGLVCAAHMYRLRDITYTDVIMVLPLFCIQYLSRFATVLGLLPVLKCTHPKWRLREMCALIISTEKGALGIALGLIASTSDALSTKVRVFALVWSLGTAFLSSLLSPLLSRSLLPILHLESLSAAQEDFLVSLTTALQQAVSDQIAILKKDKSYSAVDWKAVGQVSGAAAVLMHRLKATKSGRMVLKQYQGLSPEELFVKFTEQNVVSDLQTEIETRRRFYLALKGIYWGQFHAGKLSEPNVELLLSSANKGAEHCQAVMHDWYLTERKAFAQGKINSFSLLSNFPLLGRLFTSRLHNYVINASDAAWNFISAHIEAEALVSKLIIDTDKPIFDRIMQENRAQIELCRHFVRTQLMDLHPEISAYVQTRRACVSLIGTEIHLLRDAVEQGALLQSESEELMEHLETKSRHLSVEDTLNVESNEDRLRKCSPFAQLYETDLREVLALASEVTFPPHEFLYRAGEPVTGLFLLLKGRVEELDNDFAVADRGAGAVLGLHYLVKSSPASITSAQTLTPVSALHFPLEINQIFQRSPIYRIPLWQAAISQLFGLYIYDFGPLWELEPDQQAVVLSESRLAFYEREETVDVKNGGLLFRGGFSSFASGFAFVKPNDQPVSSHANTVFAHFSQRICELIMTNIGNLQYILLTLTSKDASGQCALVTSDSEERRQKPHFKVTLSSRFSNVSSPSGHGLPSIASQVSQSDHSDTIGEEALGLLRSPSSQTSFGLPASTSDHGVTVPQEQVISTDAELRPRLSLTIPNFRV